MWGSGGGQGACVWGKCTCHVTGKMEGDSQNFVKAVEAILPSHYSLESSSL